MKGSERGDKIKGFKSGFVTIIGSQNVGKSTLLNIFIGEKIAIVSNKPQTTRNRITGIKNLPNCQIVFIDTPGIHHVRKPLNESMVRQALSTLSEVDLILFMIDAKRPVGEDEENILSSLKAIERPVFLIINKIDLVDKGTLLPIIKDYSERYEFKEVIPVSCIKFDGIDILLDRIIQYLPEGEPYFPIDMITDLSERFLVAELIREKVFQLTKQEIPYSTAVEIEGFKEDEERGLIHIMASIYVERESQKAIVIGRGGRMLKEIGTRARMDIERLLGSKVFLELWVKVKSDWTRDERALKKLGLLY